MPNKRITTIPATISRFTAVPINSVKKRKVAGYARVSTDHEDQTSSYEAQVDYYTHYIKSRDDWEFAGLYSDEGISATNTKHRDGFNHMISDALSGKIDLIITKSVSRFARNTVDSLSTIRKLKEHNVECYFEKENIWTFDSKGELLLTIMSSLAQEESRSISENVTWGQRKRMADGKVSLAYSRFLGYDKAADGSMVINEEQAKAIRLIYKLFLEGYSPYSIAQNLTRQGILTPAGKSRWCQSTVKSILTNEKYKGDALLQKYFTESFLTHKAKKNEGQLQQYYVKDNHEAIISPELFDMVQIEIKNRNKQGGRYSGTGLFSNKLKCGDCGNWYGSKVWQSNTKYRKTIFQCNHKFKNKCQTPNLTEEKIKEFFLRAINQLIENKNEILENMETVLAVVCNTSELEAEQLDFQNELDFLVSSIESCIAENARNVQNQDEYNQKYDSLVKKYNDVKEKYENTSAILEKQNQKIYEVKFFINTLKKQNALIDEFDNGLWGILLDYGTVNRNGSITFTFKNDIEVTVD